MKNILISVIVILLLAVGGFYFYKTEPTSENYACTLEAKICPDGSAVGPVGPDCQFEACPVDTNPDITISSRLNKKVSAQGFSITPLEIMEDSRCPTDVVCVWEGTFKLKTLLGKNDVSREVILTLGLPTIFVGKKFILEQVTPEANSKKPILPEDYIFDFSLEKNNLTTSSTIQ